MQTARAHQSEYFEAPCILFSVPAVPILWVHTVLFQTGYKFIHLFMGRIVSLEKSICSGIIPKVTVFGDSTSKGVIKAK